MRSLSETLTQEKRIQNAYDAYKKRGGKCHFERFKKWCEAGQIDIRQYDKKIPVAESSRKRYAFFEARKAGYIGTFEQWAMEIYPKLMEKKYGRKI